MKRILVLSDSHGNVNNMVTAVGRLRPGYDHSSGRLLGRCRTAAPEISYDCDGTGAGKL